MVTISDVLRFISREEISAILQILVFLSGWIIFGYNQFTNKPKIVGRLFAVFSGESAHPIKKDSILTFFFVYVYLTNQRKNTVHIMNYEFEIDRGNGYEKMERLYGLENFQQKVFPSEDVNYVIPDLKSTIITLKEEPVEYGHPLHGFIGFFSEERHDTFKEHNIGYKLTCTDAFGHKHIIITKDVDLIPIAHLQEIINMDIQPK